MKQRWVFWFCAAPLLLSLAACEISNPFTTAGSLRIEVEVYKGPLSKEPAVQWGEFVAIVRQAKSSLLQIRRGVETLGGYKKKSSLDECDDNSRQPTGGSGDPSINAMLSDIDKVCGKLKKLESHIKSISNPGSPSEYRQKLLDASILATELKAKAFLWAETHTSFAPGFLFSSGGRRTRIAMANFGNWASEYSNQIGSRADALLKQMLPMPADRRELPLSVYLRDTEPTDFLNLYVWNRAAVPAIWEEMLLHPIASWSSEETTDRVRVIETLFADHNWSRINTVYASGEGKTAIALIKDDIGNWNLKSFDSDPTELLDAYKNLALAGIKTATSAISGGLAGGGPAALQSLLETVNKLTRSGIGGGASGGIGGINVGRFHVRAETKLKTVGANKMAKFNQTVGMEPEEKKIWEFKVSQATIDEIRETLRTHKEIVDILEEAVIADQEEPGANSINQPTY